MTRPAKNLNGATRSLKFNHNVDATPEAVLDEINRVLKRVCRLSIKDKAMNYPTPEEARWVNTGLTGHYINWLDSAIASARNYQCVVIDSLAYQVQPFRGQYNLVGDKMTLCVTPEQYQKLLVKTKEATQVETEKVAIRLATRAATHLWDETKGFPYFEYWSQKIDLCSNFVDRLDFDIKQRLRHYRLGVQVATSPQVALIVKEYIVAMLGLSIPKANNLQQVISSLTGTTPDAAPATARAPVPKPPAPKNAKVVPAVPQLTGDQFEWQEIAQEYMQTCSETCNVAIMYKCAQALYSAFIKKLESLRIGVVDKSYGVLSQLESGVLPRVYSHLGPVNAWYDMVELMDYAIDDIIADHEYFVTYEQDPVTFDLVRKMEWLSIRALADDGEESTPIFTERVQSPF